MPKKVKCPLCDFETDNANTLFGHMISTHCDDSGYFIDETEKQKEQAKKEEPQKQYFTCKICGAVFDDLEKAIEHVRKEHPEVTKEEKKAKRKKAKRVSEPLP